MDNNREKLYELIDGFDVLSTPTDGFRHHLADYLLANGVVVQRWISTSEPPTVTGEYIAMIRGYARPMSLFYNFERGEWFAFAPQFVYDVTHWMPLPEPPKEGE